MTDGSSQRPSIHISTRLVGEQRTGVHGVKTE